MTIGEKEILLPGTVDETHEHARPRKRARRACDKCSSSRTRCDGECPCRRCVDYGYRCNYDRVIRKRGRASHTGRSTSGVDTAERGPESLSPTNSIAVSHSPAISETLGHIEARNGAHNISLVNRRSSSHGRGDIVSPQWDFQHDHSDSFAQRIQVARTNSNQTVGENSTFSSSSRLKDSHLSTRIPYIAPPLNNPGYTRELGAFSPDTVIQQERGQSRIQSGPISHSRYQCLDPLLPYLRGIIPTSVAWNLFDVYLIDPGTSLFRCASPYILTRIFRKKSLLDPKYPRPISSALLAAILWCCVQTADTPLLHVPGARLRVSSALYNLASSLISEKDSEKGERKNSEISVDHNRTEEARLNGSINLDESENEDLTEALDDVLTCILLCINVSGGDFKRGCLKWWNKSVRLVMSLGLNREDEPCVNPGSSCSKRLCSCRLQLTNSPLRFLELKEERRRVFWLIYCLDRHLALSYNRVLQIPDSCCEVYAPLPDNVWENLDELAINGQPHRTLGPPTTISGTNFFEYFLPLMVILGDIVDIHHFRYHPRLTVINDDHATNIIEDMISKCKASLEQFALEAGIDGPEITAVLNDDPMKSRVRLVVAYSTHILHVLQVLLHGKWDVVSMLDNHDGWVTTPAFPKCASNAVAASETVSNILKLDPELTFMPYLFGIYLLHGSFILLLFADRMPQLGSNQSVEQACETVIRAHEVCIVTLSTEFQRNFRRVVRSTLYSVRGTGLAEWGEHNLARREILSLYRWTKGAKGLAI